MNSPSAQRRAKVWQAMGMVRLALGLSAEDALAGLRCCAYGAGREADVVTADLTSGRLSVAQLRHPGAGVEQQPHHLVAAAEEDGAVEDPGPAAADRAGLEQRGDLVVGEDRHRLVGRAGGSRCRRWGPSPVLLR
jgi:hypothetical protein